MKYRKNKRVKAFSNLIIWVLLILLFLGVGGFIYRNTNGFNENFASFYVEYNGEKITTERHNLKVRNASENRFNVKYTLSFVDDSLKGYHVKIMPYAEEGKDFNFVRNGNNYSFSSIGDLTSVFEVNYQEEYFTIKPKNSVLAILQAKYPDEVIELSPEYEDLDECFVMEVSSDDKKNAVLIYFGLADDIERITISPSEVIF